MAYNFPASCQVRLLSSLLNRVLALSQNHPKSLAISAAKDMEVFCQHMMPSVDAFPVTLDFYFRTHLEKGAYLHTRFSSHTTIR